MASAIHNPSGFQTNGRLEAGCSLPHEAWRMTASARCGNSVKLNADAHSQHCQHTTERTRLAYPTELRDLASLCCGHVMDLAGMTLRRGRAELDNI